jgi:TetR/AcrR family transcriptional regulator, regulator of cefoperazone and chloramphenicol sensitivity
MRPSAPSHAGGTRPALIRAAAAVFAEQGYRAATIRGICRRARANVAAVTYHFGGKRGLYEAVLHSVAGLGADVAATLGQASAPAEERLRFYVRAFLGRVLADGPLAVHGKIMAREMVDPTAALDRVVEGFIRPEADLLGGVVRELVGDGFTEGERRLLSMSVVSQVVFYKHCRPVVERLFPEMRWDASQLDTLAGHISDFSLSGFRRLREHRAGEGSRAAGGARRARSRVAQD